MFLRRELFRIAQFLVLVGLALFGVQTTLKESSIRDSINGSSLGLSNHKQRDFLPPIPQLEHFSLGFSEAMADSFWLRVIQDIDHCEKVGSAADRAELARKIWDQKGDKISASATTDDLEELEPYRCVKGWVYRMLDTITNLAPRFAMPYLTGGIALSVMVDDKQGATAIFEKGIRNLKPDWALYYRAAYHYLDTMKDASRAAELYMQSHRAGGPLWIPLLVARLHTEAGQALAAKAVLDELVERDPEFKNHPRYKLRRQEIERKLRSLKK